MHVTFMSNNNHGVALPLRQSYGGTDTPLLKRYRDPAPQSISYSSPSHAVPFARNRGGRLLSSGGKSGPVALKSLFFLTSPL
jgi:hypothetical protein